jgi:hypothetical protein
MTADQVIAGCGQTHALLATYLPKTAVAVADSRSQGTVAGPTGLGSAPDARGMKC